MNSKQARPTVIEKTPRFKAPSSRTAKIATPKLNPHKDQAKIVYPYYAGFSEAFVATLLDQIKLRQGAVILDPWNGSGTTTAVSFENGFKSIGLDLNPVMVIAAKSRIARCLELRDAKKGAIAIKAIAKGRPRSTDTTDDPLNSWFTHSSVHSIRKLQTAIHEWIEIDPNASIAEICELTNSDSLLYLSFLTTVAQCLRRVRSSNATWIRRSLPDSEKVSVSLSDLRESFFKTAATLTERLSHKSTLFEDANKISLLCGDSRSMPLAENSINCVISSPPYCTRIDYAIATSVEYATLSRNDASHFDSLRRQLMGTTAIRNVNQTEIVAKYKYVSSLLEKINSHDSYAASNYYYKNILQYFTDLSQSLKEINRVVKRQGQIALVVQDSFFKDIHIDLARAIRELGEGNDWFLDRKTNFKVSSDFSFINRRAVSAQNKLRHTESLLLFTKP